MLTCTYSTGASSPASLCMLYLVAGNALGVMRSNVWPLELVIWTAETKTGGAGQQTLRRMQSCGRSLSLSYISSGLSGRAATRRRVCFPHCPWPAVWLEALEPRVVQAGNLAVVGRGWRVGGGVDSWRCSRVWRVTGVCVEGTVEETTAGVGADVCVRVSSFGDGRWAIITRIDRKVDLKPRAWPCPRHLALASALRQSSNRRQVTLLLTPAVQHVPRDMLL